MENEAKMSRYPFKINQKTIQKQCKKEDTVEGGCVCGKAELPATGPVWGGP
jgi:tRNA G26 N,N-dimethylase Trm1